MPLTSNRKLSAFVNAGYFQLSGDVDAGDTIVEGGLNYVLGSNIVISGSYRYEAHTLDYFEDDDPVDVTISGPSVTISYFK